jgi:hypothetical protein
MEPKNNKKLVLLTGLSPNDLAETMMENPRAYMALRGAVAEKHLSNCLLELKSEGKIFDFRVGKGDFEKDFYIKRTERSKEISLECKNVEALKVATKPEYLTYLKYLLSLSQFPSDLKKLSADVARTPSSHDLSAVKALFAKLPLSLKESGVVRYGYSRHLANLDSFPTNQGQVESYLNKFSQNPLTVDFWRTRNSNDSEGNSARENRFYKKGEVEILGVCLFSRTLEWKFVFFKCKSFPLHKKYSDRFHNRFPLAPSKAKLFLSDCF